jgi:hypothetical protein
MHESDILRQLQQHRQNKHLLNIISTLKHGLYILYTASTKLIP